MCCFVAADTSLTQLSAGNIAPHLTIGHLPTVQPLPTIRDPEWLKVEVRFAAGMGAIELLEA